LRVSPETDGGLTVNVAFSVTVPAVADTVTDFVALTPTVVAVKVAEVAPAGTTTDAGTVVDGSLELRLTVTPAFGAAPLRVTVPVEEAPPVTAVGLRLTPVSAGA
jgi:hypothetical protein